MRRGGSATARRNRCARGPLEVMESRLLLSTGLNPGATAVVIPLPAFSMPASDWNPQGSSPPENSHSTFPMLPWTGGPGSESGRFGGAIAALITSSEAGSATGPNLMTVVSTQTGSLGEDSVSPVVLVSKSLWPIGTSPSEGSVPGSSATVTGSTSTSPGLTDGGGVWGTAPAGGGWNGPSGSSASGSSVSPPMEPVGSVGSPPSGPMGSTSTGLPDMPHVVFEASMASGQNHWTVQIPIDSMTHELGLTLRSPDPGLSHLPIIGQMDLLDHSGDVLAQLDPFANGPPSGPNDAVTLSFQDMPAGSELIVQISSPTGSAAGSSIPAAGGPVLATSSGSFVVDVQRIESAVSNSAAGNDVVTESSTSGVRSLIGTLVSGTVPATSAWSSSGSFSTDPTAFEAPFVLDAGSVAQAVETMALEGSSDEPPARIAVGPLASRAAAPIGPSFSSVEVDPAPAIDRHERALADAIATNGLDTRSSDRSASALASNGEGGDAIDRDGPDRTGQEPDSVVGLGPLRLMASRTRRIDRQGSLDALYAAMGPAGSTGTIRSVMNGDSTEEVPVLVQFASPESSAADRRPTPDYLTSACFVALGMGLIARPILPDLIRLLPSHASRWGRRRFVPTSSEADAPLHRRTFETWLRRRLDLRTRPRPTVP